MADLPFKPPARALVVGINEYDRPGIQPLRGCVADAEAVAAFLASVAGMEAAHVRLLLSPARDGAARPTRANLLAGLRQFLAETPPGEEALFYYSGHGSTAPLAPEIAFGDGMGETLVPCDARTGDVLDLLDRELRLIASELLARGIRLTVIADSCHSAGVLRGDAEDELPRARTTGKGLTRTLASLLDGSVPIQRLRTLYEEPLPGLTLLSGSQGSQKSFEVRVLQPDGSRPWRGALTVTLLEALRGAGGPLRYRELLRIVRARLPAFPERGNQLPALVGASERRLFSAEEPVLARPLFVAMGRGADGTLLLDGGLLDGLAVGAELHSFADWSLADETGHWQVVRVESESASALPLDGASVPLPGTPLRLHTVADRWTLRFATNAALVAGRWASNSNGVALMRAPGRDADYTVVRVAQEWVVRRAAGSAPLLRQPATQRGATDLVAALDRLACYERFVRRQPPPDQRLPEPVGPGALAGLQLQAAILDREGASSDASLDEGRRPIPGGQRVRLTLRNGASRNLHAVLYRLDDAQHALERLWPDGRSTELRPGDEASALHKMAEAGHLALLLLVGTRDTLPNQKFPCGEPGTVLRGARDLEGMILEGAPPPLAEGWAVLTLMLGRA